MSETATRIDAKTELAGWTRQLGHMYSVDLAHVPETTITNSPGGSARSVGHFTAEVVGLCYMAVKAIQGEQIDYPSDEARAEFESKFTTKEFCQEQVQKASNALADALEAATDEQLSAQIMAPWGQPMTAFGFATIAANHILYHDGQLNYIQALNGDAAIHWME